jgi:hypothetical protein
MLIPGSDGVRFDDGLTNDPVAITLNTGAFILDAGGTNLVLTGGTASITAAGISIGGTVNGSSAGDNNLLLDASGGAANRITVAGAVGNITPLGDIVVRSGNSSTSPYGVTFTGAVTAASYTQTGTGSATLSSTQNYTGDFSFTSIALWVVSRPLLIWATL